MPKVSVIIPDYNRSNIICKSIGSILNQTYKDFEIIVVDDGSTDNTKKTLEPYISSGKIRYFYQENKGPGAARNKAIKESIGEYIANLDSDDIALPQRLEKEVEILDDNLDIGLVYSDIYVEGNKVLSRWKKVYNGVIDRKEMLKFLLLNGCFIINSSIMYRKQIAYETFYNEDIKVGEDFLFIFEIAAKYLFYGIDSPLAILKRDNESLVKNKILLLKSWFERINAVKNLSSKNIIEDLNYKEAISMCYLGIAKDIFYSKGITRKKTYYFTALIKSFIYKFDNIYLYKHIFGDLLKKVRF